MDQYSAMSIRICIGVVPIVIGPAHRHCALVGSTTLIPTGIYRYARTTNPPFLPCHVTAG